MGAGVRDGQVDLLPLCGGESPQPPRGAFEMTPPQREREERVLQFLSGEDEKLAPYLVLPDTTVAGDRQ